jgi:hypothetical protein
MRSITCGSCHASSPMNSAIQIDDVIYCETCLKEKFPDDNSIKGKNVVRLFDPTICFSCASDAGDTPLPKLGEYPVCETCSQQIKERIFPTWVKAFFAGVLLLVAFSLIWNWRFIRAHDLLENSRPGPEASLEFVHDYYEKVSADVPEISDFYQLAQYHKGVMFLNQDKGEEAYEAFKNCGELPENYQVNAYMTQAEVIQSFNTKDYVKFVMASQKFLSFDTSSISRAQVASAYACLYADQKADSSKVQAEKYLNMALSVGDTTKYFADYVNRIRYRLATGEIIDKEEFDQKFPNGWTNK